MSCMRIGNSRQPEFTTATLTTFQRLLDKDLIYEEPNERHLNLQPTNFVKAFQNSCDPQIVVMRAENHNQSRNEYKYFKFVSLLNRQLAICYISVYIVHNYVLLLNNFL